MAGDWMPIQTDLCRRREVLRIAEITGLPRRQVVGTLIDLWGWASQETDDGILRDTSVAMIVTALQLDRVILDAIVTVKWLIVDGDDIQVPHWDRWLSNSAKARMGHALRQKIYRQNRAKNVDTNVGSKTAPQYSTVQDSKKRKSTSSCARERWLIPSIGVEGKDACLRAIYMAYPRHVGPRKATEAIEQAVRRVVSEDGMSRDDALERLLAKAGAFGASPAGKCGLKTALPTTWFNRGSYDDDETEWQRDGLFTENSPARIKPPDGKYGAEG